MRRIAIAAGISVLLHGLLLWGPKIRLPQPEPQLPPLVAKLERLPTAAPAKPKRRPPPPKQRTEPPPAEKVRPQEPEPQQTASVPVAASTVEAANTLDAASAPVAASSVEAANTLDAASAPAETAALATDAEKAVPRPPLPRRARLSFAVNKGINGLRVGEAIHTLEIDDLGHYVLQAETRTIGLVRLFKRFDIIQYSSGSYRPDGLHPASFFEERRDGGETQRHAVEFDHTGGQAHFSSGRSTALPPDTQDILSIMYQFPPLQDAGIATVYVSNGRKIETYEFEIDTDEEISTPYGKLLAVRLRKLREPDEEGLEIWLAREYRLFPVMMRFIERNGEVTGEAVITDIRVSEEEGEQDDAVD